MIFDNGTYKSEETIKEENGILVCKAIKNNNDKDIW